MTGGNNGRYGGSLDDGERMEPELLAIARRLDHDGDTWQRGLPDEARTTQRVIAAISSAQAADAAQRSLMRTPPAAHNALSPSGAPAGQPRPNQPHRQGSQRAQRLLAVAAMLAVVVLLAALLRTLAVRQAGPHPTATATAPVAPTATGFPGTWSNALSLQGTPAFAPSDPRVIYEVQLQTPGKPGSSTTSVTLRRSDDAGTTWQTLALPTGLVADNNLLDLRLVVSPVDSQVAFLYSARSAASCAPQGDRGIPTQPLEPRMPRGSGGVCLAQYRSADGGATWTTLALPVPGVIAQVVYDANGTLYALVAQPLYGSGNAPPDRLIASNDGGLTWHVADVSLWAQQLGIAGVAASRSGMTVWAFTNPVALSQNPQAAPRYQLWRSDDGGTTWRLALSGTLPYPYSATLIAGAGALYQIAPFSPTLADQLPAVSTDGGATWTKPPTAGLPADVSARVLASVDPVVSGPAIIVPISDGGGIAFYAWQPGAAAWAQAAPTLVVGQFKGLVAVSAGGKTTLWALFAKVGVDGLALAWLALA